MGKKNNYISVRFSTILWCFLATLLCATPSVWAVYYNDGGVHDVTADLDWLQVGNGTTVNLYASVSQYVFVYAGSALNIHSGNVGWYVAISPDPPDAVVKVYGTGFAVDGAPLDPSATQFTVDPAIGGVLTGTYENGDAINLKFHSHIPIYLEAPDPEVAIDIRPGGNPNTINLKSKGVVPVAVLTTDDFDASTVDPTSVEFAEAKPVRWRLADVDDDGDDDTLFHFRTQDLNLDESSTEATLTGKTTDGKIIHGADKVRIVAPKKPKKK